MLIFYLFCIFEYGMIFLAESRCVVMKNKKVKCAVWALIIALFMVRAGYLIIDQNKTIPATNNAEPKIVRNNTVDNIVFDDTKVNVYICYGDGCEDCNE